MNKKYMEMVFEIARTGIKKGQSPFAACIVKNEEVISCSYNSVFQDCNILSHAEMNVIRAATQKLGTMCLEGADIYCSCEPCPMCFSACHWAKISSIIYSTRISDSKLYGFNELLISNQQMIFLSHSKVKLYKDVLREEGLQLFEEWKKAHLEDHGKKKKSY